MNADWIQLETPDSPSPRANTAITYDEVLRNVVLFGGFSASHGGHSDTWKFDGANWTEVHPIQRPTERATNNLRWCPCREQLVVVTGVKFSPTGGHHPITGQRVWSEHNLGDTWIFDGENWQELHPSTSPSPREEACMTYDSMNGQVVLFGGRGDSEYLGDTWVLVLDE